MFIIAKAGRKTGATCVAEYTKLAREEYLKLSDEAKKKLLSTDVNKTVAMTQKQIIKEGANIFKRIETLVINLLI